MFVAFAATAHDHTKISGPLQFIIQPEVADDFQGQAAQDRAAPLHFQVLDPCLSLEPQHKLDLAATRHGRSRDTTSDAW